MTSAVAGLTVSKFSATQGCPCAYTVVSIALTIGVPAAVRGAG